MLRAAVLGHPIAQSFSPRLHGFWLERLGINGSYEAMDTLAEMLSATLERLAKQDYAGVNLTLPLKEIALPFLDIIDPLAERIGAVNTVVFHDGKKLGYNTDAYGFMQNSGIAHQSISKAVVLGAGGAARAVVVALMEVGVGEIVICNRSEARARELVASLTTHHSPLTTHSWEDRSEILKNTGLLVNTTSLGMTGQSALEIDLAGLPKTSLVTDIVYKPLRTELLKAAAARGNPTIDGLGMLLYQGQKAFELFFGVLPEVTEELREAMLA